MECCGDLIKSLLIEGVGRFDRPHPHTSMARSSLFQCPCVLEVWLIVRLILDCTGKEFGCEVLCTFASAHFTLFIILVVLGDALSDLVYNDIT